MDSVESFEAKTHLASLLQRVAKGETILITKHGKPIARLVPPLDERTKVTTGQAIAELLEFRSHHQIKTSELKTLINQGRKY